jgi:hypothetical protein
MARKGMTRRNYKETILNLIEMVEVDKGNPKWQIWQLRAVLKELKKELDVQEEKVALAEVPRARRVKSNKDGSIPA